MKEVVEDNTLCTWQPASECSKPFVYRGVSYDACTDVDNPTPWCSHDLVHDGDWSVCQRVCTEATLPATPPQPVTETVIVTVPVTTTEEPLTETVTVTVPVIEVRVPVAVTTTTTTKLPTVTVMVPVPVPAPTTPEPETVTVTVPVQVDVSRRRSRRRVATNETTTTAATTATTTMAVTTSAAAVEITTTATTTQAAETTSANRTNATNVDETGDAPCDRHPDAENDVVGNYVTLDEEGYRVLAQLESPINTKRFICRVVDKIDCKVVDLPSLFGFVPYYRGVASHQTYRHLEEELTMICHLGGKWIVPK